MYNKKLINTVCWITGIVSFYVILVDVPLLTNFNDKVIYAIGRVLTGLISFVILINLNVFKKNYKYYVHLMSILLFLYSVHGQIFFPCYYLAYMQSIAAISFFFPLEKRFFYPYLTISSFLMVATIILSGSTYSLDPNINFKFKFDASMGVIIIFVIAFFGYRYITLERFKKDILYKKFVDVGKNSAEIIHNLKGVVFSPALYISLIEKNVDPKNIDSLELVNKLKNEYNNLIEYIQSLNNLSKNNEGIVKIDSEQTIQALLKTLFKNKTSGKEINIKINGDIFSDLQSFRSIIINLLSNSFENFSLKETKNPKIDIEINNQQLIFSDNGGGFSKKALLKLKQGESFTEKETGSGLGFFIIKETIEEQGGKVSFYNKENELNNGAVIELNFNKKGIN